jgi:hypothetical protein
MIAISSRGVDGFSSRDRRVDGRPMRRRIPSIPNNSTLASIVVKVRRLGDNPGPSVASACTRSRRTVGCSATVFEVARPLNRGTLTGLAWIVSAQGSPQTSQGLMNRTPKQEEGSVRE